MHDSRHELTGRSRPPAFIPRARSTGPTAPCMIYLLGSVEKCRYAFIGKESWRILSAVDGIVVVVVVVVISLFGLQPTSRTVSHVHTDTLLLRVTCFCCCCCCCCCCCYCCCSHMNSSPQCNSFCGRRTGSNNSEVEAYLGRSRKPAKRSTHHN